MTDWNKNAMAYGDSKEPERYYEWMLWKLRQEGGKQKTMSKDVKDKGYVEFSKEDMFKKEIADMQKSLSESYKRILELKNELYNLKSKIMNHKME